MGLKVAVAGKGGSGKTTVSVLLARLLAAGGRKVLLVDLDSDPNLAGALGVAAGDLPPLVRRNDLVAERTGSAAGPGGFFIMNPGVSDLADRYALRHSENIFLLPVGTIENAGEGCFCPQTAFVRALVRSLVLKENESVVMDLEAGLESFGRAAAEGLDLLLVVVEPGKRSVDSARRIAGLVAGLGIREVRVVANKVRPGDLPALARHLADAGLAPDIVLRYSGDLIRRDLDGRPVVDHRDEEFEAGVRAITGRFTRR